MKFKTVSKIVIQISISLSLIYQNGNKKLSKSPEVQNFLTQYLQFQDKQNFVCALIFLVNLIDNCLDFLNMEQSQSVIQVLLQVFDSPYDRNLGEIYFHSLQLLNTFAVFFIDEIQDQKVVTDYLQRLFTIQKNLAQNQDFLNGHLQEIGLEFVALMDFLNRSLVEQKAALNDSSIELMIKFILVDNVLLNPLLEESVKISALDLNKEICLLHKKFYNPKNNHSYYKYFMKVYFELIQMEENRMKQEALEDPEKRLDQVNSDSLQSICFSALDVFFSQFKNKKVYG